VGDVSALRNEIELMIAEIRSHPEGVRTNHRSLIEKQFSHEACYAPVLEEYRKALAA
jgi:hypothetical protein